MEDWQFEKIVSLSEVLKTPKGFVRNENLEMVEDPKPYFDDWPKISFVSEDKSIEVIFSIYFDSREKKMTVDGTTNFVSNGKKFTFDRRGIDSSFYLGENSWSRKISEANEVLAEQIERAKGGIESKLNAIDVPGLHGINISPNRRAEATKKLQSGEEVTFTPSGMGIGFRLSTRRSSFHHNWIEAGQKALCDFFNVRSLWFETIDCD